MRQLSRLRTLSRKEDADAKQATETNHHAGDTPRYEPSGRVNSSGGGGGGGGGGGTVEVPGPSSNIVRATKRSLFLEHENDEEERGCMEAVSAFLAAIATAYAADNKQDSKGAAEAAAADGALPALLQTSKGAGTIECRDSARELLRFFGHAPLLHLEGVIWVKTSGERVHCLGALSNWSLFLIPLRDPSFIGGVLHGFKKAKQNISDRIVEVPLSSIVDVTMVSGREHLKTFRSFRANSVSRPFRIVTIKAPCCGGEVVTGPAANRQLESTTSGVVDEHHHILLVGFEDICRLRHFLVLACESWAIRTGGTLAGPTKEMLPCAPVAALRYISGVFEAMTGPLRNQVDAQVELMEDLANEMLLDAVVKETFFSTGDIFFEIARRLEAAAAAAAESAIAIATEETTSIENGFDGNVRGVRRRDSRCEVVADARLISAAAAVLDAAFFHSLQFPQRIDFVGKPKPTSLPVVAENLLYVYCALRRRIVKHDIDTDGGGGTERRKGLEGVSSAGVERLAEGTQETADAMISWDEISRGVLDRVVRALNGMSDVVSLFNIENEKLGLVRHLVGVGLGTNLRAGIQPEASDALALLVAVNDRAVGLIEDLDRREQKRRQLEAERLLALKPATVSSPSEKNKGRKRSVFARLASLSPTGLRSRRSLTPPLSPAVSPTNSSRPSVAGVTRVSDDSNGGGGLQHISEGGRSGAVERRTGKGVPIKEGREEDHKTGGGLLGLEGPWGGRRGAPPPPPEAAASIISQTSSPRGFLWSAPVLLHSYAKLLNALVCGSYNLRAAFFSSCEADVRNIGREGGYLDMLAGLDSGAPRTIFRQTALFLDEILVECHL